MRFEEAILGLTLIRKSRGAPPSDPKVALVLAGGAVTGGAFKVGGLKALDDYFTDRRMNDLDTFVGLSAGAFLAAALSAGVTPDEMIRTLEGKSRYLEQLRPLDFYNPNWREFSSRPASFALRALSFFPGTLLDIAKALPELPEALGSDLREFARKPSYTRFESLAIRARELVSPSRELPSPSDYLPSGLFDNRGLERWLRRNFERMGSPNDFLALRERRGRSLYITACNLDTAEREIFGPDENARVSISQAVQASTALPLLYRPARIGGADYVDGGVYRTANIDVAIEKGADLIVCYNPFRPILNTSEDRFLSDFGLKTVLNQSFRTLLHSRLQLGLQRYLLDTQWKGDIVVLEPSERDLDFFNVNPLAFWKRRDAIEQGFLSVRATIEENFPVLEDLFARYGIAMSQTRATRRAERAVAEWGFAAAGGGDKEDVEPPALRVVAR